MPPIAFSSITALIVLISVYFYHRKFQSYSHPIILISIWWWFWHFISVLSLTGNIVPGFTVNLSVFLMIVFFNIGGLMPVKKKKHQSIKYRKFYINKIQYGTILLIIISPVILFLMAKSIMIINEHGIGYLRSQVYSMPTRDSVLYPSPAFELIYNLSIKSILFLLVFIHTPLMMANNNKLKTLAIATFSIFLCDEIMRFGRFNYYYIIILIGSFIIYSYSFINKSVKRKLKIALFPIFISILAILIIISTARGATNYRKIIEQVIDYHTISFVLYDQALEHNRFKINDHTYGRLFFHGAEYVIALFARQAGFDNYKREFEKTHTEMQRLFKVTPEGQKVKTYNAFYGFFYNFYRDFGLAGFIIFPFFLGMITNGVYINWKTTHSYYYMSFLLFVLLIGVTGIFMNPFNSFTIWISGISIYFLSRLPTLKSIKLYLTRIH